jgi:hypothetical protein
MHLCLYSRLNCRCSYSWNFFSSGGTERGNISSVSLAVDVWIHGLSASFAAALLRPPCAQLGGAAPHPTSLQHVVFPSDHAGRPCSCRMASALAASTGRKPRRFCSTFAASSRPVSSYRSSSSHRSAAHSSPIHLPFPQNVPILSWPHER